MRPIMESEERIALRTLARRPSMRPSRAVLAAVAALQAVSHDPEHAEPHTHEDPHLPDPSTTNAPTLKLSAIHSHRPTLEQLGYLKPFKLN
jgi:hypothetical protein